MSSRFFVREKSLIQSVQEWSFRKNIHGWKCHAELKIGVAGCRNACGSVYSKDVGLIADKTGFIVCAGGSGGYNPRLADVIAKDLTEKEALKMIDNIFEYYKENAEPGEKLGFFIDRIGLDNFKLNICKWCINKPLKILKGLFEFF